MVCVYCGQKTSVTNSRLQKKNNQVWRRRLCNDCGALFTTHESIDYSSTWSVIGAQTRPTPFLRNKLLISLYDSLKHRTDALEAAEALCETVIRDLARHVHGGIVSTNAIISTVTVALTRYDTAASVHYASFHSQK